MDSGFRSEYRVGRMETLPFLIHTIGEMGEVDIRSGGSGSFLNVHEPFSKTEHSLRKKIFL